MIDQGRGKPPAGPRRTEGGKTIRKKGSKRNKRKARKIQKQSEIKTDRSRGAPAHPHNVWKKEDRACYAKNKKKKKWTVRGAAEQRR